MSDTISKDPKMQEEARRAAAGVAAAASLPKTDFDIQAIAREEFSKRIDPKYLPQSPIPMTFESLWELLTRPLLPAPSETDVLFALTEQEYRQLVASLFKRVNALNLELAAKNELQKAESFHGSAVLAIEDRLSPTDRYKLADSMPDVLRGVMRKASTLSLPKLTCALHPEGCPDPASGIEALKGLDLNSTSPVAQAIQAALDRIVGSRKR